MLHGSARLQLHRGARRPHPVHHPHEFAVVIGPSITTAGRRDPRRVGPDQPSRPRRDPAPSRGRQHRALPGAPLAACARSSRRRTWPASPPPCSALAPSPRRSPRRSRTRCRRPRSSARPGPRQAAAAAATEAENAPRAGSSPSSRPRAGSARAWSPPTPPSPSATLGHNVCLIDLDVNSGDVAIMLQALAPPHDHRPGRLQRRHRQVGDRLDPDAPLRPAVDRRRARAPRLARPGHQRRRRQA